MKTKILTAQHPTDRRLSHVSIIDPTPQVRWFLMKAMRANNREDPFYKKSRKAVPFLQCDSRDYMLIEFWTSDTAAIDRYVAWLNSVYDSTIAEHARLWCYDPSMLWMC